MWSLFAHATWETEKWESIDIESEIEKLIINETDDESHQDDKL